MTVAPFRVIGGGAPLRLEEREVYFIQGKATGLIKIGHSNMANERLVALQTTSPDELTILGVIISRDAEGVERRLHRQFDSLRLHGEWFTPGVDLLAYIAENTTAPRGIPTHSQRGLSSEPEPPSDPARRSRTPISFPLKGRTIRDRLAAYKAARGLA